MKYDEIDDDDGLVHEPEIDLGDFLDDCPLDPWNPPDIEDDGFLADTMDVTWAVPWDWVWDSHRCFPVLLPETENDNGE